MRVVVFEGERPLVKQNHKLGSFEMTGIPPAPKGVGKVDVTFALDENSILTVTAVDMGSKNKKSISITNEKGRLSQKEIDKMIADAEKYAEEDRLYKEKSEARHALSNYIDSMSKTINDSLKEKLDDDDRATIQEALTEARDWYESNMEDASKDDFEEQMKDLQRVCDPIIASIYGSQGGQGGSQDDDDDDEMYDDL